MVKLILHGFTIQISQRSDLVKGMVEMAHLGGGGCLHFWFKSPNNRFYAYKTKAKNPGNTVAATNPVLDLLMTSNDL